MRGTRSQTYQYKVLESPCEDKFLAIYSNQDGIGGRLSPNQYNEQVLELYDQIKKLFWILAEENLTEHQFQLVRMVADGYTQMEIAKVMNISQSCVTKGLTGAIQHDANDRPYYHGGAYPKLRKLVQNNREIQRLLILIDELTESRF